MGSFCPFTRFPCNGCARMGRCDWPENLNGDEIELWDVDGLGLVCEACTDPWTHKTCMRWLNKKFSEEIAGLIEKLTWGNTLLHPAVCRPNEPEEVESEESASPTFDLWSLVRVAPEGSSSPTEESASPRFSGQSAEE